MTTKGLALLVINCPEEPATQLPWASARFAATCSVNQQPVLLSGVLVQLGALPVMPYFKHHGHAVPDVPVACARVIVFADQWPNDWQAISDHTFKHVLRMLPPLQTCRNSDCSCDKWQAEGVETHSEPLLDVFRRQFCQ